MTRRANSAAIRVLGEGGRRAAHHAKPAIDINGTINAVIAAGAENAGGRHTRRRARPRGGAPQAPLARVEALAIGVGTCWARRRHRTSACGAIGAWGANNGIGHVLTPLQAIVTRGACGARSSAEARTVCAWRAGNGSDGPTAISEALGGSCNKNRINNVSWAVKANGARASVS